MSAWLNNKIIISLPFCQLQNLSNLVNKAWFLCLNFEVNINCFLQPHNLTYFQVKPDIKEEKYVGHDFINWELIGEKRVLHINIELDLFAKTILLFANI